MALKDTAPVVVNSVEKALKGLQPPLNKNKESAQLTKNSSLLIKISENFTKAVADVALAKDRKNLTRLMKENELKISSKKIVEDRITSLFEKLKNNKKYDDDELKEISREITELAGVSEKLREEIDNNDVALEKTKISIYENEQVRSIAEKNILQADQKIADANKAIVTAEFVAEILDDKTPLKEKEALSNAAGGQIYASTHAALLLDHGLRNVVQAHMPGLSAQPVLTASNGVVPAGTTLNTSSTRTWASTWGFDGKTSGSKQDGNLQHKGSGLAVGGDVRVGEHAAVGLTLGFEDGKVANNDTQHAHTQVKAYTLGSYASVEAGSVTLQGGVLYSRLDLTTDRDLDKLRAGVGQTKASYKGSKVKAFAEVSRAFEVGAAATVAPYANLTQTWLRTDKAQERGSSLLTVAVKAQRSSALQSTLGVRASYRLPTAAPVALTAHLGWAHAFGNAAKMSGNFAGSADNFALKAARTDKDHALIGVGVEAHLTPRATLAVSYDGQIGSHDKNHAGSVQFKLRF